MATAKLVPRVKRIGRILRDAKEKKEATMKIESALHGGQAENFLRKCARRR
jgi:hypothetical protein